MGSAETGSLAERRRRDRRRARPALVYPERRTGFDRRIAHTQPLFARYLRAIGSYSRNENLILLVLAHILVLNIADFVFTHRALQLGAFEANPIMAVLFASNPALAAAVKLGVALLVVVFMWGMRRYRRMLELSILVMVGYATLFAYHLATASALG